MRKSTAPNDSNVTFPTSWQLRVARAALNLSQTEAGALLGMHLRTYQRLESGEGTRTKTQVAGVISIFARHGIAFLESGGLHIEREPNGASNANPQ
jgi:DNA-binding XRE family transcriptional regulator